MASGGYNGDMFIALIHWRIRPDKKNVAAFLKFWKTKNTVPKREGLIGEFLSDGLPVKEFPYITWHLDSESLGNFKSFVTVGLWRSAEDFDSQISKNFNDDKPLLSFEKYRRRRVIFQPVGWRMGKSALPDSDSPEVK